MYFENLLNAALILENKHRFRDDPLYREIMRDMWSEGLTSNQIKEINKQVVMDKRSLLDDDCHYACPTNQHKNIILANNFRRHILATHRVIVFYLNQIQKNKETLTHVTPKLFHNIETHSANCNIYT
jgi:hypothetical protein